MQHPRTQKPWATFDCLDCGEDFQVRWIEGDEDPECPSCWRARQKEHRLTDMLESGIPPAVSKGIHGADVTYKMMEKEYGITDLNDNLREGDVAFKGDAPKHTREMNDVIKAELDLITARSAAPPVQPVPIQANWGGQSPVPQEQTNAKQAIANARGLAEQARKEGADPMSFSQGWRAPANVVDGKHIMNNSPKVLPAFKTLARADSKGNVIPAVRRRS